jgi:hypothetical protein
MLARMTLALGPGGFGRSSRNRPRPSLDVPQLAHHSRVPTPRTALDWIRTCSGCTRLRSAPVSTSLAKDMYTPILALHAHKVCTIGPLA